MINVATPWTWLLDNEVIDLAERPARLLSIVAFAMVSC